MVKIAYERRLCAHGEVGFCHACEGIEKRCPDHPWNVLQYDYCPMCDALVIARIVLQQQRGAA